MSLFKKILAGTLGVGLLAGLMIPAEAAPLAPAAPAAHNANVVDAQYWRDDRGRHGWRGDRGPGWRHDRGPGWRGDRGYRHGYYRGHRGYREYRHGYRRYSDGFWYPLAAFGAGAIIGGALAAPVQPAPPPVYQGAPVIRYGDGRHVDWCSARYRSYRASDNTFQPNRGGRQQCVSPYM